MINPERPSEQNLENESHSCSFSNEQESVPEISYMDLIKMYYYEAKEHENPFYRRHFERVMAKLKNDLVLNVREYIEHHKTDAPIETAEGALYGYFKSLLIHLEREDDPKRLAQRINAFIMYIHERLRLNLGEELLGFSAEYLEALNYMDPDRPLEEQEEIIWGKMQEEKERYSQQD